MTHCKRIEPDEVGHLYIRCFPDHLKCLTAAFPYISTRFKKNFFIFSQNRYCDFNNWTQHSSVISRTSRESKKSYPVKYLPSLSTLLPSEDAGGLVYIIVSSYTHTATCLIKAYRFLKKTQTEGYGQYWTSLSRGFFSKLNLSVACALTLMKTPLVLPASRSLRFIPPNLVGSKMF